MRAVPLLLAVVVSLAAALLATWPAPVDATAVVGHWNHPDCLSNHWLLEWVVRQVRTGGSLTWNDRYYWPVGDAPLLAGNGSEGFLYLPFRLLLPWPAAATAFSVALIVANGVAAWWAAVRLRADATVAAIAAAAFAASPYIVQELGSGRFTQADVAWVALAIGWVGGALADTREGRPPSARSGAVGGALAGLAAVLYWYHGVFVGIAAVALLAPHLAARHPAPWRAMAAWVVAAGAVTAGPLAWYLSHWSLIVGTDETVGFPHPEAWGDSVVLQVPLAVEGAHLGFAVSSVVLALAAAALLQAWRTRKDAAIEVALASLVAVAVGLAAGPRLFGGYAPGLYDLVYGWAPPLRRFWWPSRHLVLFQLGVSLLAARGATRLLATTTPPRRLLATIAASAAVPLALFAAGDLVQIPLSRFDAPPFYQQLRAEPAGVLAEVPISPKWSGNQQMLVYQLIHDKPLLGGHAMWVDRVRPDDWDAFVTSNSLLAGLAAWEEGSDRIVIVPGDVAALRARGLAWIALNREYLPLYAQDPYRDVLDALFGRPRIATGKARLYALDDYTGATSLTPPPVRLHPSVRLGNGVHPLVGLKPGSLGLHVLRDTSRPFQGLHPSGGGQPVPGAPPPP